MFLSVCTSNDYQPDDHVSVGVLGSNGLKQRHSHRLERLARPHIASLGAMVGTHLFAPRASIKLISLRKIQIVCLCRIVKISAQGSSAVSYDQITKPNREFSEIPDSGSWPKRQFPRSEGREIAKTDRIRANLESHRLVRPNKNTMFKKLLQYIRTT